jgi:hypothetical protein
MRKKKNILSNEPYIPAKDVFFTKGVYDDNPYQWQSWGLVIRRLRAATDMDQDVFGRLLQGFTRMQISRYETEAAEPPIDFWKKMMKMFGLNICWAITGYGIPYIEDFYDSEERNRFLKWTVLINEKEGFIDELRGK